MNEIGIENFMIYPLEIATNNESAGIKEKYYIDLYDSINNGYNVIMGSSTCKKSKVKHTPTKQTIYSKVSKSKIICCVNPDKKEMIFSTGLKLFGDYIGRSKDEIKSAAKRETKLNGYFIYYMNQSDISKQLENAINKIQRNHIYNDNLLQYSDFIKYYNYVNYFIYDHESSDFSIKFITLSVLLSNSINLPPFNFAI